MKLTRRTLEQIEVRVNDGRQGHPRYPQHWFREGETIDSFHVLVLDRLAEDRAVLLDKLKELGFQGDEE